MRYDGTYVTIEEMAEGLLITITDEGRDEQQDSFTTLEDDPTKLVLTRPEDDVLVELFEDIQSNSGVSFLDGEIGLTESPIIGMDVDRDDYGNLVNTGSVYWFPNYQVESPVETLMNTGRVVFTRSEDEKAWCRIVAGKYMTIAETIGESLLLTITDKVSDFMQGAAGVEDPIIWRELMRDIEQPGGYEYLTGKLGQTNMPLIGFGVVRDDAGEIESVERIYSCADYEGTVPPIECLLNEGLLVLTAGPPPDMPFHRRIERLLRLGEECEAAGDELLTVLIKSFNEATSRGEHGLILAFNLYNFMGAFITSSSDTERGHMMLELVKGICQVSDLMAAEEAKFHSAREWPETITEEKV